MAVVLDLKELAKRFPGKPNGFISVSQVTLEDDPELVSRIINGLLDEANAGETRALKLQGRLTLFGFLGAGFVLGICLALIICALWLNPIRETNAQLTIIAKNIQADSVRQQIIKTLTESGK